ncbi:MAG: hypothetical protein IJ836_02960 [Spirochaetales bacterium]|nr:hypothetical protein [Spirochaetales bacterium]
MKKTLIVCVLALSFISAAFASNRNVKLSGSPYALQGSTSSTDGQKPVWSRYGLGLEAVYQRGVTDSIYVEWGIGGNSFFMPGDRPVFGNLLVFTGAGYAYDLDEKWTMNAHLDVGIDFLLYKCKASESLSFMGGIGAAYKLRENLDLTFGLDASAGFAKRSGTDYRNYRIIPKIGVSLDLK